MARTRTQRGVLLVLSGLLVGSGLLRAGNEASQVLAESTAPATAEAPAAPSVSREEIAAVLKALDDREARLEARELQLADRMQALRVAEGEISRRLEELLAAEQGLSATIAQVEEASEGDLDRLVSVYENMRPADASELFETMAPDFAAGFIGRMRPDAAAEILTGLEPSTAYSISVILAGRNANAPRE